MCIGLKHKYLETKQFYINVGVDFLNFSWSKSKYEIWERNRTLLRVPMMRADHYGVQNV